MIGVAGCVWGDYHKYVARWYESLAAADTTEIVLVTDEPRPDIPCRQIVNPPSGEYREASWWTVGVNELSTEYRATLGVDDEVYPDAWTTLEGDVMLLGMRVIPSNIVVMPPYDTGMEYVTNKAMIAAHVSPFRAEWFQGYPQVAYSDTKLYLDMARRGAVFHNPKRVGLKHYDSTPNSLSKQYAAEAGRHREEATA